jgi:2-polyprenyl-3-methyl-5-hydroxy-6-metoxy-1,4-benzoquinol methylase
MTTANEVRDFYNRFVKDVLLLDFYRFNLRQDAIRSLCDEFVPSGARVLEIGSGVGIIAKHLAKRASFVLGIDISERNIMVARAYAGAKHCRFEVMDVLAEADALEAHGTFDIVLLPDVVEHIPKDRYRDLFATIRRCLAPGGRVILTYPSPEYQEFLKANDRDTLQVVDETVEMEDIVKESGLALLLFRYKDVWKANQYVHVVLTSDRSYDDRPLPRSAAAKWRYRVHKYWWRFSNLAFLRHMRARLAPGPKDGGPRDDTRSAGEKPQR